MPAIARQRSTRRSGLVALCLLAGLLSPAFAASEAGDVYVAGGDVHTGGPIRGDFGATGGRVSLDGPVAGSAWVAGGSVEVHSPVGAALRIAGGDVRVDSEVGGNLVAAGGQVAVGEGAVVAGTATLYAGRVSVDGRIDGDLHASARQITINGEVRGDVDARADTIELGPNARIGGTLRYRSRTELRKADGATIGATVLRKRERAGDGNDVVVRHRSLDLPGPWRLGSLAVLLSLLVSAAVFLALVPRYAAQAADRLVEGPLGAVAMGVVAVVMVPVVAVLLCITLLGIPLGLLLLAVYPLFLLVGFFVGVLAIARRLAFALHKPQGGFAGSFGWFVLALVLALLIGSVPGLGKLAIALLVLGGSGTAIAELQRRRKGGGPAAQGEPVGAGLA